MNTTTTNVEFNNKKFVLEETTSDNLKELTNYIPNLLNHLWENPKIIATLLSNSNIKDIKNHLASFIVNNFYENILLSNSIENNLMYVFTLMLRNEIKNLKSENECELFLNKNSPCHYLFKELIRKDSIRQYFKRLLLDIIDNLEVFSSDKTFNLNIKNLQEIFAKNNGQNDKVELKKMNKTIKVEENEEEKINLFRLNYSYTSKSKIEENLKENKTLKEEEEDDELHNLDKFTEKYVATMTINDIKKMIVEKYNNNQNMKDYCTNQLINCGQNIVNRDYYSNKIFMEKLFCSPSSRDILQMYQKDFIKIIDFIEKLFKNIKNSMHLIPYSVKCLCKIISILITKKFPDINVPQKTAYIAQFFFNQLLIPILQNPGFGLLIDNFIISKNTLKNIKIIIEIISQLVSGKLFQNSEKNSGFTPFNWYFLDKITDIFSLLEDLSNVNLPNFIDKLINNNLEENYHFDYFNENPEEDMFYRAICFNLYDIRAILNNMNKCQDEILNNINDLILKKTFEKLFSETNQKLIEKLMRNDENQNIQKQKISFLKFNKEPIEAEENKVKQKLSHYLVTSLLTNDKYIEIFNTKFESKYSIKELKTAGNQEERAKNNIIKVKNFLISLLFNFRNVIATDFHLENHKNTIELLHFLKEYSKNSNFIVNDFIPLEWYINSLLEYLKKIPDAYAVNDFEKLYKEIEEELKIDLKKIDFEIISTFFEKVKLAQRENIYYEEINRITNNLFLNERVQKIVEEEFIPIKLFFSYNNEKKEFYFKKSKTKEKDYAKKKAENKVKNNFCKTIKVFTKKFPNLTLCENKNDIFEIQVELNIPEKITQYLDFIIEHLIANKKVTNSIDIELISRKIYDYIMSKIYNKIFPNWKYDKDEKIERKCKLLVWTKPKHFIENKKNYIFDCFLKDAIYYFKRIEEEKSLMKKILSIKEIFNSIYKLIKFNGDDNKTGIDDLMPILNYAFIKANPERIYSNIRFIDLYIGDLRSKEEGSQLTQLIALCDFICNIQANNLLGIDKNEFTLKCGIISLNLKLFFD